MDVIGPPGMEESTFGVGPFVSRLLQRSFLACALLRFVGASAWVWSKIHSIDPSESSRGGGIDLGRPGSVRYNLRVNEYFREPDRGIGGKKIILLKVRASAGYFLLRGFRTIRNKLKKLGPGWVNSKKTELYRVRDHHNVLKMPDKMVSIHPS